MADQTFEVNCGFFNSMGGDREYYAEDMNRPYKRVISNGVFATPQGTPSTDLQVNADGTSMNITVNIGDALFANKWFENPAILTITVPSNTGIVGRIDSVIAQVDTTQSGRAGNIVYREGTPASNPVAPSINQVAGIQEYRLANISVSASATSISQANITDTRGTDDCPWVTSLIQQVDTSELFAQWEAAYEEYYEESTQDFNQYAESRKQAWDAWFSQLTDDLTVSTNLVMLTNTVVTTGSMYTVPIGIPSYNSDTDILQVYMNGLRLIEGTQFSIDGVNIVLSAATTAGQTINFMVLKSVVTGDVQTVTQLIQELDEKISDTMITTINGAVQTALVSSSDNILDAFLTLGVGFHTLSAGASVAGLPKAMMSRFFGHLTNLTAGYLFCICTDGSTFVNFYINGTWKGWRCLFDAAPSLLYKHSTGVWPTSGTEITPSKPLSACQHGWVLTFTSYQNSTGTDNFVQHVLIPKVSYKGQNWAGESMTFPLVYSYNSDTGVNLQCVKSFQVYDTKIVSNALNAASPNTNMVIRSIQEY